MQSCIQKMKPRQNSVTLAYREANTWPTAKQIHGLPRSKYMAYGEANTKNTEEDM
jgi:hypothetical protein